MKASHGPNDWRVKWTEQDLARREQSARRPPDPNQKSGETKTSAPDFSRFYDREESEELAVILLVALDRYGPLRGKNPLDRAGRVSELALTLLEKSNKDSKKTASGRPTERPSEHAAVVADLARMLYFQGDLDAARHLYEKAVQINRVATATGSSTRAITVPLITLAWLVAEDGDYAKARSLLEQAIAISKAEWRELHPDYPQILTDLAIVLMRLGDYAAAKPLVKQAREIAETVRPRRENQGMNSRGLGTFGLLGMVRPRRENQGMNSRGLGMLGLMGGRPQEPDADPEAAQDAANSARILTVQARLLVEEGDDAAATPLLERAMALFEEAGAKPYPGYDTCLGMLAGLLRDEGDFAAAKPLYEKTLAVTRVTRGERNRDYAIGLANLAFLLMERDNFAAARPLLEQALEIRRTGRGGSHPDYARIAIGLAWLRHLQGEDAAARPLLVQALAIIKATPDELHLAHARTLSNLGWLLAEMGDRDEALGHLERALGVYHDVVVRSIASLPERQRLSLIARFRYLLDSVLSLTAGHPEHDAAAYRHLLSWKGLIDSGSEARRLAGASPQVRDQAARLNELRKELTSRYYARVPTAELGRHAQGVRSSADRYAMEETRLAAALGAGSDSVETAEVSAALPTGAALIDLLRHVGFTTHAKAEDRYAAFVIRSGSPPRRVELGPAEPIDQAVAAWRAAVQASRLPDTVELIQRVWRPLEPLLDGRDTVLVAPDGAFNFLPMAALPDPRRPGSVLLERFAFATVGSARMLVEAGRRRIGSEPETLLVVGGVDYQRSDTGPTSPPPPGFPAPA